MGNKQAREERKRKKAEEKRERNALYRAVLGDGRHGYNGDIEKKDFLFMGMAGVK